MILPVLADFIIPYSELFVTNCLQLGNSLQLIQYLFVLNEVFQQTLVKIVLKMAVLKNKGLAKFYAYIIIYINANLKVSHVADKNPGTERCALRLWHPDFDNGYFGQVPVGGNDLREDSIISLRIRAYKVLSFYEIVHQVNEKLLFFFKDRDYHCTASLGIKQIGEQCVFKIITGLEKICFHISSFKI